MRALKKLLSLTLALAMSLSLLCVSAQAANPVTITTEKMYNLAGDKVTLSDVISEEDITDSRNKTYHIYHLPTDAIITFESSPIDSLPEDSAYRMYHAYYHVYGLKWSEESQEYEWTGKSISGNKVGESTSVTLADIKAEIPEFDLLSVGIGHGDAGDPTGAYVTFDGESSAAPNTPSTSAEPAAEGSCFTFSNEPVGYALITTGNNSERWTCLTMIVPDGTTCTVIVPKGASLEYTDSEIVDNLQGVDGGFASIDGKLIREVEEPTTVEISNGRSHCSYTAYSGGHILEHANFVTQSVLDTIMAESPSDVEMVSTIECMTSKTMQLVDKWALESVDRAVGLTPPYLAYKDLRTNITRSDFAAVAVELYEVMSGESAPKQEENPFSDVESYGSGYMILQAYALGIVNCTNAEGTLFNPDGLVTREQAAVMLSRVYEKLGGTIPSTSATTFSDDGKVSGYAKSAVAFMADKGIVGGVGDNQFNPQGNAKCEEALVIALRMLETLK
ncbi:MAG: S-layer homology domain-containing protein [Oscillibacter sp.]|nr:S-layer homology domain-containing protein [Oscillibacter sp.]